MSIDQSNFDPTRAPAREDVISRGVRLGTAATVIASFYASAPTMGMIDNFFNPELLEVWPLRDAISLSGINQLLAGHDHQGPLRSDWLALYGYNAIAQPTETQRGATPEVQQKLGELYSRENFSHIQVHNAPADHIAAVDTEGALLLKGDDAREIDAQAWRAWHRNQMQPNQPQSHTQQAQTAIKTVAIQGGGK